MPQHTDPLNRLIALTLSLLLAIMVGWLLLIGKAVLLPIVIGVLSVYVIAQASRAMAGWRATRWMPSIMRKLLLTLAFVMILAALSSVVIVTVRDLADQAPLYQANLEVLIAEVFSRFGLGEHPDWDTISAVTFDRIDMQALIGWLAGSLGSMVGVVVLAAVYAVFLAAETGGLGRKLAVALPSRVQALRTQALIEAVNQRIGEYLAVKTFINVIIGVVSWAIMALIGLDHALFWGVMIGLLNYIPYFGSLVAVGFAVLMAMVQFGALSMVLLVGVTLTAANMWVGNWLEPRMIGQRVNMSPFVVVAALSFWTSFWGVAGAILAVPLTSMVAIILAASAQTRALAVMLADDVSEFERPRAEIETVMPPRDPDAPTAADANQAPDDRTDPR